MPFKKPSEAELEKERKVLTDIEKLENSSEKLKRVLELIDGNIFPENPLPVKIVKEIKSKYEKKIPAAAHYFDEGKKGKIINEHYRVNKNINENKKKINYVIEIAIHEVRHRIQHTFPIELFSKGNWEKFEEKYPSLKLLKERLPRNLSSNDFDACIVEDLSSFLKKNGVSLLEISTHIIPKNAKEIFKNIEILAKNKKFIIPKPD